MTDHITQAAQEAGFAGWKCDEAKIQRLYAIAFQQGMERAAEIAEAEQDRSEEAKADARFRAALKDGDERSAVDRGTHWMAVHTTNAVLRNAAKAIRAHAKNQPKNVHDGSVV